MATVKRLKKIKISDETIRELFLVGGFLLLGYGVWLIFKPAAFIVSGILLLWVGIPPRQKRGD